MPRTFGSSLAQLEVYSHDLQQIVELPEYVGWQWLAVIVPCLTAPSWVLTLFKRWSMKKSRQKHLSTTRSSPYPEAVAEPSL